MNDDTINAASKRISLSIIIGSLIIATCILLSSPTGKEWIVPLVILIGLIIAVVIISALLGTGTAKITNRLKRSISTNK